MISPHYLIAFQCIVFILYITAIWKKYGVLPSISDSWYVMPKGWNNLFTFFIWAIALPMCFLPSPWFFLAGGALCFTGAAAAFRQNLTNEVHGMGAIAGIALALVGLLLNDVIIPLVIVLVIATVMKTFRMKDSTWWIEIIAFISIEIGLLYQYSV